MGLDYRYYFYLLKDSLNLQICIVWLAECRVLLLSEDLLVPSDSNRTEPRKVGPITRLGNDALKSTSAF